jgi:hypothetical protein|tara:strand:- start:101 stop:475 length:375 start_codon:yes stop_codon:yes gene_type:complete
MNNTPNHKDRRRALKYVGALKEKGKLNFADRMKAIRENQQRGREIHQANLEQREKELGERLEEKESSAIQSWKVRGYNDEEIEMLKEAWAILAVKDKETWHTDKKVARKLMKSADALRNKRLAS